MFLSLPIISKKQIELSNYSFEEARILILAAFSCGILFSYKAIF